MSKKEFNKYLPRNHNCKCPSCGKTHKIKMIWTGNGMPRKFCGKCQSRPDLKGGLESCTLSLNY